MSLGTVSTPATHARPAAAQGFVAKNRKLVAVMAAAGVAAAALLAAVALKGESASAVDSGVPANPIVAKQQADNADPNLRNAIAEDASAGRAMVGGQTK